MDFSSPESPPTPPESNLSGIGRKADTCGLRGWGEGLAHEVTLASAGRVSPHPVSDRAEEVTEVGWLKMTAQCISFCPSS